MDNKYFIESATRDLENASFIAELVNEAINARIEKGEVKADSLHKYATIVEKVDNDVGYYEKQLVEMKKYAETNADEAG